AAASTRLAKSAARCNGAKRTARSAFHNAVIFANLARLAFASHHAFLPVAPDGSPACGTNVQALGAIVATRARAFASMYAALAAFALQYSGPVSVNPGSCKVSSASR